MLNRQIVFVLVVMVLAPGARGERILGVETTGGDALYDVNPITGAATFRVVISGGTGVIGALAFFGIWEAGHYATPESGQRFLPAVEEVLGRLRYLFAEKAFLGDVLISCLRIFGSFLAASAVAVPLGIAMGCFGNLKALERT